MRTNSLNSVAFKAVIYAIDNKFNEELCKLIQADIRCLNFYFTSSMSDTGDFVDLCAQKITEIVNLSERV